PPEHAGSRPDAGGCLLRPLGYALGRPHLLHPEALALRRRRPGCFRLRRLSADDRQATDHPRREDLLGLPWVVYVCWPAPLPDGNPGHAAATGPAGHATLALGGRSRWPKRRSAVGGHLAHRRV